MTIPALFQHVGSVVNDTGILIRADQDIVLIGLNKAGNTSCGAFLILPIGALDKNYYTASWSPPTEMTQMGVVAVTDETTVRVSLSNTLPPVSVRA